LVVGHYQPLADGAAKRLASPDHAVRSLQSLQKAERSDFDEEIASLRSLIEAGGESSTTLIFQANPAAPPGICPTSASRIANGLVILPQGIGAEPPIPW
jgi:hypothetical protein